MNCLGNFVAPLLRDGQINPATFSRAPHAMPFRSAPLFVVFAFVTVLPVSLSHAKDKEAPAKTAGAEDADPAPTQEETRFVSLI